MPTPPPNPSDLPAPTVPKRGTSSPTVNSGTPAPAFNATSGGAIPPDGDDFATLIAIAMAQLEALGEINKAIVLLEKQRAHQFDEEKKRRFDLFQVNNRLVQQGSQIGQAVAGNQGASAASGTLNMASDLIGKINSPLAKVVSGVVGTFATLIMATKALVDAFVNRGLELAQYSPSISIAESQSDVRRMMADIREAQALGDDYARLIEAQTDVEIEIREILIPIKKFVMEILTPVVKDVAEWLKSAKELSDATGAGKGFGTFVNMWDSITKAARWDFSGSFASFKKMFGDVDAIKKNTTKDDAFTLIDDLLKQVPNVNPMPVAVPAAGPQLAIPLILGL